MKKWIAAVIAAVLLIGVGVTVAVSANEADPLISLSYLEETYIPALKSALQQRAQEKTKAVYDAVVGRLNKRGEEDLEKADAITEARRDAYTPVEMTRGDSLDLDVGGSIVACEGLARIAGGALTDVTAGKTLKAGDDLTVGHRYVVTSEEMATVQMTTKTGSLGYQGIGEVREGDGGVLPFRDVPQGSWYFSAVEFVYEKGYFQGAGIDQFVPLGSMTRSMLATVLSRVAGSTEVAEESPFDDVPMGTWYTDGVAWAARHHVVDGMGDGTYKPNDNITREQMVTMLFRYMRDVERGSVSEKGDLSDFPDGEKVSSWAQDAVTWAVGVGLIQGRDTGLLDPGGHATRAEVSIVLQRFDALLKKS